VCAVCTAAHLTGTLAGARDTNEQLLIAALHSQNIAVEALSDLREFTWWSERATDTAGLIARADAAMHVSKRRR
jgi:hypothetical protein